MKVLESYYLNGSYGRYLLWGDMDTIENSTLLMGGWEFDPDDEEPNYSYEIWNDDDKENSSFNSREDFLKWWEEKKEYCINSQK